MDDLVAAATLLAVGSALVLALYAVSFVLATRPVDVVAIGVVAADFELEAAFAGFGLLARFALRARVDFFTGASS